MTDAASGPSTTTEKKRISLDDIPWYTVPAFLLGVPALLAILSAIWPETFYDNFVDKYYFSPIRGDSGYNPINTASWAVLLGLSLLGLSQMMTALKVRVDDTFIYGAVAWVVTGSLFRVVEDMNTFQPPLQYIMITPPIYLLFAAFAIISLLMGIYVHRTASAHGTEAGMQKLWLLQAVFVLIYTLLWAAKWDDVLVFVNPVIVALFAALNHFIIRYRVMKVGGIRPSEMMLLLAIAPFLMGMVYIVLYLISDPATAPLTIFNRPWGYNGGGIASSFVTVPLLAIGLSGAAIAAIRAADPERPEQHRWTAGFAAFFAVVLGIVIWTAPETTRTAFSLASVASIVGIGLVLGGLAILMSRLLRHRPHIVHAIIIVVLVVVGYGVGYAAANYLLSDVFNQTPATWSLHAIAAILVLYLTWNNREAIQKTHAYLKTQDGIGSHITGPFMVPLNIFLIVSQVMDGFATSLGLDLAGYSEKHVLSASLINGFHDLSMAIGWEFGTNYPTFLGFVPIKLGISLAVVYAIDVYSREDVAKYPNMIGLVKFAIIMVGIGPAVRDFARLSVGV